MNRKLFIALLFTLIAIDLIGGWACCVGNKLIATMACFICVPLFVFLLTIKVADPLSPPPGSKEAK